MNDFHTGKLPVDTFVPARYNKHINSTEHTIAQCERETREEKREKKGRHTMKKRLLAALLTSALALSLTACGGGTDSSATDGGDTASTHDGPYKISMVLKTNAAEF